MNIYDFLLLKMKSLKISIFNFYKCKKINNIEIDEDYGNNDFHSYVNDVENKNNICKKDDMSNATIVENFDMNIEKNIEKNINKETQNIEKK